MNILVIGTGYVGLTTAVSFAMQGHQVIGVDVDESKVEQLQRGQSPIYEPGLEPELQKALAEEKLSFTTTTAEAIPLADVIYVCVGTPSDKDGFADLTYLNQALETMDDHLKRSDKEYVLVIKSTVPIGTTEQVAQRFVDFPHIHVVSNPEFLREGRAMFDSLHPSRIVIGADSQKAFTIIDNLYSDSAVPRVQTTRTNAEMIKYASNSFLATRISFMNELARLCHVLGANVDVVAEGMGLDSRIGPEFLRAGVGYGGSCFPKDTEALIQLAQVHQAPLTLLEKVRDINEGQADWFVDRILEKTGDLSQKKIALLGLSFKPETDDIREAPALRLISRLQAEGAEIVAFDPIAAPFVEQLHPSVTYVPNPYEAFTNADVAVLVTEWNECTELNWQEIKSLMKQTSLFDGRNAWPADKVKELGFSYLGVGRN